jgi:phage shock protein C
MTGPRHTKFYLDPENGQWRGVCAGVADYTGADVTFVRIALVVATLALWWPIIPYLIVGHVAKPKPRDLKEEPHEKAEFWQHVRTSPKRTLRDVRSQFRDIDRRLADVEAYVTNSNTRLAREIDELR